MSTAFTCRMCGHCCQGQGGIVLTAKDIRRLAQGLNISSEECLHTYTTLDAGKQVLTSQSDGTCVFFQSGRGCTVHAHKPDVCRAWPFFRGNLEDEFSWRMAQESCPGINPDIPHQEFVRQGLLLLHREGLIHPPGTESPTALTTGHLLPDYTKNPA